MTQVLHVTPHLGGGVGKAVSGLIRQSTAAGEYRHSVLCLENPEKTQFTELLDKIGCPLRYCPNSLELTKEIEAADIVQLEFWNHPAIVKALCSVPLPDMRLLVWCHVSGLHFPAIPWRLVEASGRFLFTSPCSLELLKKHPTISNVDVVSSGGGMDEMPAYGPRTAKRPLAAGYLGTLNFSKLHPDFVAYAAAVRDPEFHIRMIGDEINREVLERQCAALGQPDLLEFCGYRKDVAAELAGLDVLVYLLNPTHYGTAENTLLEAMAMGVVPIVLDNPAERHIVENGRTGLVVRSPAELADAIAHLSTDDDLRARLGRQAAESVRQRHTYARMADAFDRHYRGLLTAPKKVVPFSAIFGAEPADWFMAFQPGESSFSADGAIRIPEDTRRYALFERTKGSVFHFLDYFPEDPLLSSWAKNLRKHDYRLQP